MGYGASLFAKNSSNRCKNQFDPRGIEIGKIQVRKPFRYLTSQWENCYTCAMFTQILL